MCYFPRGPKVSTEAQNGAEREKERKEKRNNTDKTKQEKQQNRITPRPAETATQAN